MNAPIFYIIAPYSYTLASSGLKKILGFSGLLKSENISE